MLQRFVFWFMSTWFYKRVCCWVVRTIRLPILKGKFSADEIRHIESLLKPGDILLVNNPWKLQSWMIPGRYEHGAMVVDKSAAGIEIGEMTAAGYGTVEFKEWLKQYTQLLVLRVKTWDTEYTEQVVHVVQSLVGTPYDDQFILGPEAVYCFELCIIGDIDNKLEYQPKKLVGLERWYVDGDCLADSHDVEVIYER